MFMLVIYVRVKLNPKLGPRGPRTTWSEKLSAIKDIAAVAILAILVMGGIWGGVFSPTEAGGVGALGAFTVGLIVKRLTFKNVVNSLRESIKMTAMCLTILIGAMIFNYFIVVSEVAIQLAALIDVLPFSQRGVMSAMLIIFLILGCIMDTVAITVLTLPIFLPALTNMGFDLVWFGVVFTVMCEMALITPPIGMNVFIISGMVKDVPMYTVFKGVIPFFGTMILCVILLIIFPQIVLFLPNTVIG
jgi:tripartite ATP-independent transporter DctM subunit